MRPPHNKSLNLSVTSLACARSGPHAMHSVSHVDTPHYPRRRIDTKTR